MSNLFSVVFYWVCVSLVCDFVSSDSSEQEEPVHQRDINTIFMKLNEKFDFLDKKIEKLELYSSTGKHVPSVNEDEIRANVTQMWGVLDQVFNKLENFEQQVFKKFDKIEHNDNPASKVFVIQLGEVSHQEVNEERSKNDMAKLDCESKINILANQTRDQFRIILDKFESITPAIKGDDSVTNIGSHQKVSDLCNSNPCLNGGRCEVILNGSDYHCLNCSEPTSGKRCENSICKENKCFHRKDIVYVVFETNFSWEEANRKCVSEGMRLTTPKDQESNEFLANQLRILYKSQKDEPRFWFGLKNLLPHQKWQWIDGSPLGEYTGGRTDDITSYPDLRAGALFLDGETQFWACHQLLDEAKFNEPYQIYALCEQNYSTFSC